MRAAQEIGKEIHGLAPDALETLQRYPWPGNVRELQHAVERAVILNAEPTLQRHSFDLQRYGLASPMGNIAPTPQRAALASYEAATLTGGALAGGGGAGEPSVVLHTLNVAEAERVLIEQALAATENNRTRAAELLGISVRTLRNKLNSPDRDEEEGE